MKSWIIRNRWSSNMEGRHETNNHRMEQITVFLDVMEEHTSSRKTEKSKPGTGNILSEAN